MRKLHAICSETMLIELRLSFTNEIYLHMILFYSYKTKITIYRYCCWYIFKVFSRSWIRWCDNWTSCCNCRICSTDFFNITPLLGLLIAFVVLSTSGNKSHNSRIFSLILSLRLLSTNGLLRVNYNRIYNSKSVFTSIMWFSSFLFLFHHHLRTIQQSMLEAIFTFDMYIELLYLCAVIIFKASW